MKRSTLKLQDHERLPTASLKATGALPAHRPWRRALGIFLALADPMLEFAGL